MDTRYTIQPTGYLSWATGEVEYELVNEAGEAWAAGSRDELERLAEEMRLQRDRPGDYPPGGSV